MANHYVRSGATGTGGTSTGWNPVTGKKQSSKTGELSRAGLTAQSTLTLAPAANTVGLGFLLTDTTAASSGNQQYSPSLRWTGQGWKTTATAASQAVDFRAYVVPVQGTANPSGRWTLESSINGASFAAPLLWTSGGVLQVGGTTSSFVALKNSTDLTSRLAVRLADDSAYGWLGAAAFEVMNGSNRVVRFDTNMGGGIGGMGMASDYRVVWASTSSSSDANVGVNGDIGIGRNAAGVAEINNGLSAGTYRDLKLRAIEMVDGNLVLGTATGTKIGTATGQKLGFWNATPVVQQVLATGAAHTVDDVITLMQTLGLCKQS